MALDVGQAEFEEMQPEVSSWSVASAAWDNTGLMGTMTTAITQGMQRKSLSEGMHKVTPAEANTMFPGLNADRDISLPEAEFIMERKNKVAENQATIDRASDSFLKGTALPFVAGAARAMVDPLDMGINLITGGIGTGLTAGASLGKRVAIDALEAATGAAIAEVAVAKEMGETFEEYTSEQFLQNVIGASVMQIGLTHGVPAAWKSSAKTLEFMGNKSADNLIKMVDVLENRGVSSFKGVSNLIDKVQTQLNKSKEINKSATTSFGDKVELGDDLQTTLKNVVEAHEKGLIDDVELQKFADEAVANGVDKRILNQSVDNETPYIHTDEEISEFKDIINDEKSKVDYDPEAVASSKELDDFDPNELQKQYSETEYKAPEGEEIPTEIVEIQKEIATGVKEQELMKDYANCVRGV